MINIIIITILIIAIMVPLNDPDISSCNRCTAMDSSRIL